MSLDDLQTRTGTNPQIPVADSARTEHLWPDSFSPDQEAASRAGKSQLLPTQHNHTLRCSHPNPYRRKVLFPCVEGKTCVLGNDTVFLDNRVKVTGPKRGWYFHEWIHPTRLVGSIYLNHGRVSSQSRSTCVTTGLHYNLINPESSM